MATALCVVRCRPAGTALVVVLPPVDCGTGLVSGLTGMVDDYYSHENTNTVGENNADHIFSTCISFKSDDGALKRTSKKD